MNHIKSNLTGNHSRLPNGRHNYFFYATIAIFSFASLYKFTTPSMWHDEMMVAVSSWLDFAGVIKKYYYTDFHPPYYPLIIKTLSYISGEDYILKILSPIATILSIYVGHKESSQFGDKFRISLAIIMATNFWVILLSRQLRPYALSLLFSTYCFYAIIKISTGTKQSILLYSASLFSLGLLHYGNMLIIAPQVIFLALHILKNKPKHSKPLLTGVTLSTCLSLALILPFYLGSSSAWMNEVPPIKRIAKLVYNIFSLTTGAEAGKSIPTITTIFDLIIPLSIFAITIKFVSAGIYCLINTNKNLALFTALWIIPSVLYLTIPARQYLEFQAWHLTSLLPALFFLCATGAQKATNRIIIVFTVLSVLNILSNTETLYTETGAKGIYKTVAKIICETNENTLNIIPSAHTHTFTSWYVERECKTNRLSNISFGPETSKMNVRYFSGAGALAGMLDQDDDKVITTYFADIKPNTLLLPTQGALDGNKTYNLSIYEHHIDRTPSPSHELNDNTLSLISSSPFDIINNFNSLNDVSIKPLLNAYRGGTPDFYMFPSKHDSPGLATFKVINNTTEHINIKCEFISRSNGSITITTLSENNEPFFSKTLSAKSKDVQKYSCTIDSPRDRPILIALTLNPGSDHRMAVRSNMETGITLLSVSAH